MKLTKNNYFSTEAEMAYISNSQIKAFSACEAAALAQCKGEYARPSSQALAVGSLIDAIFDGPASEKAYMAEHPELYKRGGVELKKEFADAVAVARRMREDDLLKMLTTGLHQKIVTGVIAGEAVKGKIDCLVSEASVEKIMERFPETKDILLFSEGAIVDVKSAKDFADVWSPEDRMYVSWGDAWGYDQQGAIYQELLRQMTGKQLPYVLAAGTKEATPSVAALHIPQPDLDAALRIAEDRIPRIGAIKRGEIEPHACGHCAYCRAHRKLSSIANWRLACEF